MPGSRIQHSSGDILKAALNYQPSFQNPDLVHLPKYLYLMYFCRIGTCGGIGLPPGTVVVTEEAVDGRLRPFLDTVILGKVVSRAAKLDPRVARKLVAAG